MTGCDYSRHWKCGSTQQVYIDHLHNVVIGTVTSSTNYHTAPPPANWNVLSYALTYLFFSFHTMCSTWLNLSLSSYHTANIAAYIIPYNICMYIHLNNMCFWRSLYWHLCNAKTTMLSCKMFSTEGLCMQGVTQPYDSHVPPPPRSVCTYKSYICTFILTVKYIPLLLPVTRSKREVSILSAGVYQIHH